MFKLLVEHLLPLSYSFVNKTELQELINHRQHLHLGIFDLLFFGRVCHLLYGIDLLLDCLHDLYSIEIKKCQIECQPLLQQHSLALPLILLKSLNVA